MGEELSPTPGDPTRGSPDLAQVEDAVEKAQKQRASRLPRSAEGGQPGELPQGSPPSFARPTARELLSDVFSDFGWLGMHAALAEGVFLSQAAASCNA